MTTRAWGDEPVVDVFLGVHSTSRPVERAVRAALRNTVPVRVTVVAHNVGSQAVRDRLGALANDRRVRIVELQDGVRSPANAFNKGLEVSTATYVSVVGSDDELAPGALDAWVALAERHSADVVVAPIFRIPTGPVPSPRVRAWHRGPLDGDRDRLFERTAPLGLLRRVRFADLRYPEGLPRGVDQAYGLHLWFTGARIVFDPSSPAYLEHDDQQDRVTRAGGRARDDLAYLGSIEQGEAFRRMSTAARRAVAAKIVRVHVLSAVERRIGADGLDPEDREDVASAVARLTSWAPGVLGLLAIRDHRALTRALSADASAEQLRAAFGGRSRYLSPGALVTRNPLRLLHRHAPLRSLVAGYVVARRIREARAAAARTDAQSPAGDVGA
ncbi:glycosyltransferase [Cellulosimicrobium cellulans]|uniref:glycosyltransferase n=1 Tax=Cellulosimicrobium cellulans TaxID=1710 RepID=UPI002097D700|nr:glycosyltransferase [Cellulosimicrobium cellulans]MCO7274281.1 glycosyltransferase [Cellulosimicrobium cellulans]